MASPILLDLSRLLARARFGAPTGIDRVEHTYAEHLLARVPDRVRLVAMDRIGRLRRLPDAATRRFVAALGESWSVGTPSTEQIQAHARRLWMQALLSLPPGRSSPGQGRPFYMLISHRHLHRRSRVESVLQTVDARLVTFIHDLIPIEFPEYARPQQAETHQLRIATTAALAEAVVVNSHVTERSLRPHITAAGRQTPILVAPLGLGERWAHAEPAPAGAPYFVFISTIEPRKNHLLLLQIWRRLAERYGEAAPRLVIIGRRGWENENVVDFLERAPSIRRLVTEQSAVSDHAIGTLLHGARAMLFPSFAEGYGLPVAEALACGVPVICSDLPALREVGGDVPEYLDPIDGIAWMAAIEAYLPVTSPRRAAQMERMRAWHGPTWPDHFTGVLDLLDMVDAGA